MTALLLLRRKPCYGSLSSLKIHRPRPCLNPQTLAPMAKTITNRPPRSSTTKQLTPLTRIVCEKLTVAQLSRNVSHFMGHEGLLPPIHISSVPLRFILLVLVFLHQSLHTTTNNITEAYTLFTSTSPLSCLQQPPSSLCL
jgi:hypothetical protein